MLRGSRTLLAVAALVATSTACTPDRADQPVRSVSLAAAGTPTTAAETSPSNPVPSPGAPQRSPTGSPTRSPADGRTGISGTTVIDPACPVQRADPPCPDRPVAATLAVLDATGAMVTTVDSATDGHFTVDLPPASYILRPVRIGTAPARRPTSMPVTVASGRYTTVKVRLDIGIR